MTFATTDLCDAFETDIHAGKITILPPVFQHYGQASRFHGQAVTIKAFEDNTLIKQILENEDGTGKILIIDSGASLRCAVVGGNLATSAVKNGWAGLIVNGCIRDVGEIMPLNIGVRALATHPRRSIKRGLGVRDVRVDIQGVAVNPNDWLYADADGVLVSGVALSL